VALAEALNRGAETTTTAVRVRECEFTIAGRHFMLNTADIEAAVELVHRPIQDVSVRVPNADGSDRQLAVKELLRQALRLKYGSAEPSASTYTTQTAERILLKLGFKVQRRR
jgi:hypothetical protein